MRDRPMIHARIARCFPEMCQAQIRFQAMTEELMFRSQFSTNRKLVFYAVVIDNRALRWHEIIPGTIYCGLKDEKHTPTKSLKTTNWIRKATTWRSSFWLPNAERNPKATSQKNSICTWIISCVQWMGGVTGAPGPAQLTPPPTTQQFLTGTQSPKHKQTEQTQ